MRTSTRTKTSKKQLKCAHFLTGVSVSPGIAISKAFLLLVDHSEIARRDIDDERLEEEVEKFKEALTKAKTEIRTLQHKVAHRIGEDSAKIFDVHQLLLQDQVIIDETISSIRNCQVNADYAFNQTIERYKEALGASPMEFFQSRISDLKDVSNRVIRHIQGDRTDYLNKFEGAAVIVAPELTPSDTVKLDKHKVMGFATEVGGRTSHVAIMARSMEVPAVVGVRKLSGLIKENDRIIVDGNHGVVLIDPDEETIKHYRELREQHSGVARKLSEIRDLPCITTDGKEIELSANLEFSDEVEAAKSHGAKGVGLYRTDYLYLASSELPTEEEQLKEYRKIVEKMAPEAVIIRTMDLGGDKQPRSFKIPVEENPFLGWRAIRISLERKDIFDCQLRAILRASHYGNVKMMFPMISGLDEVFECKVALEKAKEALRAEGHPFDENVETGVMIEVPSAALLADKIAEQVDFLSIGTNDLVQYALAVDRGNERISYLYQHLHPAVLRLIKKIIEDGHKGGVWVGMCGEMASDPLSALILLGMELDEFSVSPSAVPEIKKIIRSMDFREAVRVANKVLDFEKASDVERFMVKVMRQKFKDLNY